ncbi:MAG: hypothetical protein A3I75_02235 [Deltaproteobacteria bacterium RIFCSPLOWO2_02_FULL_50_16]|nr:MAG: hypothetical protein A3B79_06120 [Deltaproteobacteria bacterium RIFCSPHIGHO2_02_FULL_50_15]OGQ57009.1 MAG: hypothetical protein A3I75_02235 [Deltaproteobacteria bacterium RIFCSPLOWO2_02_FULL_50_16]OGQ66097.1 MAG: hypothetical protein A3F89_08080 [Deltaproteobacteria bacterium RIFCSPLOWO2_12_FULL_50_11]
MKSFKVALLQMQATKDPLNNMQNLQKGVQRAVNLGADVVCGPELFYILGNATQIRDQATPIPGPVSDRLSEMARRNHIYLFPGTLPELAENGALYNTLVMFDPEGHWIGRYRKRHLFWVDIPGGLQQDERKFFDPGTEEPSVIKTPLGNFGTSICYDLRFSEHYRFLAMEGAEIHLISSAFTKMTGQAHWKILCQARAIETLCFVLAPNQTGHTKPAPEMYGHSLIIDPWGRILQEAGAGDEVIVADLEESSLMDARRRLKGSLSRRDETRRGL